MPKVYYISIEMGCLRSAGIDVLAVFVDDFASAKMFFSIEASRRGLLKYSGELNASAGPFSQGRIVSMYTRGCGVSLETLVLVELNAN